MSSKDKELKDVKIRIEECIHMKTQLTALGALVLDKNRMKISSIMNDFISNGQSAYIKLPIDKRTRIIIQLSSKPNGKSGFTLES
jgi:hypothetical protein